MNSRQKGARGERELANVLKSYGYEDSRRGQQYCGSNGDADVVGLSGIHIECKRVEKLNLEKAMEQAEHDRKEQEKAAVFHNYLNAGAKLKAHLSVNAELQDVWAQGGEYLNVVKLS